MTKLTKAIKRSGGLLGSASLWENTERDKAGEKSNAAIYTFCIQLINKNTLCCVQCAPELDMLAGRALQYFYELLPAQPLIQLEEQGALVPGAVQRGP